MVGNELAIVGSALSSSRDIKDVIGWLEEGAIDPRPIVAHTPPLNETALAMREMDKATARVGKTVIRVDAAQAGAPDG
jgi:threonine dehydrogenase-like Zn-dependent dehydrogenase